MSYSLYDTNFLFTKCDWQFSSTGRPLGSMLTCSRRSLTVFWRVFEARCHYQKHAPSIRRNTFKYFAKLAYCFILIHCFVKVSCPILLIEFDVPVILLNNGIRVFYFVPSDQHLDHQVTAVPAHTFAQYANSIVNYNIAMHGRSD